MGGIFYVQDGTEQIWTSGRPMDRRWMGVCYQGLIVIVPKNDGGIRIFGDYTSLNQWIIRPTFEASTPFQEVRTIPSGMRFFTVIDALKGYHQVKLDEESSAP